MSVSSLSQNSISKEEQSHSIIRDIWQSKLSSSNSSKSQTERSIPRPRTWGEKIMLQKIKENPKSCKSSNEPSSFVSSICLDTGTKSFLSKEKDKLVIRMSKRSITDVDTSDDDVPRFENRKRKKIKKKSYRTSSDSLSSTLQRIKRRPINDSETSDDEKSINYKPKKKVIKKHAFLKTQKKRNLPEEICQRRTE